jgi:hypothetical protein
MDLHLDTLLGLPDVTVFTCYQKEGFIFLDLELINLEINCPHCQTYTDKLHQDRPILEIYQFVDQEYISKFLAVNLIALTVKKLQQNAFLF